MFTNVLNYENNNKLSILNNGDINARMSFIFYCSVKRSLVQF